MRNYKNKVTNLKELEDFLLLANQNRLYYNRINNEFIDLDLLGEDGTGQVTSHQIDVISEMYDTDLTFLKEYNA